ncbi:hypothetical protein [Nocardia transvalensis]|uniref:hypothetical protein n=1 Tax=Nocardia transvalensis TaxID=37333 RepID=UPI00189432B0|nr:hypothetical protein [Nocardia transvalensis]MBF6331817.1 hypothetical protein [Nocardia transvalensis]
MSGGDPVDEGGQAVRTGFIQAMQTTAMTMNLLQRRGAESRSIAEFQQRQADRASEQRRNGEIHELQAQGYRDRAEKAQQLHDLEVKIKQARLAYDERSDARREAEHTANEARRNKIHGYQVQGYRAERIRKDAIHAQQMDGYTTRKAQAAHLHNLDAEYKKLLIDGRRRAMGFTETLADISDPGLASAATSAAAWAAARSTADLSDDHQTYSDAYSERYAEDTGEDPTELIGTSVDEHHQYDYDTENSWPASMSEAMAGVAEELTFDIYAGQLHDPDNDSEPVIWDGTEMGAAIEAAGLTGAVPESFPTGPVPETPGSVASLDTGIEP